MDNALMRHEFLEALLRVAMVKVRGANAAPGSDHHCPSPNMAKHLEMFPDWWSVRNKQLVCVAVSLLVSSVSHHVGIACWMMFTLVQTRQATGAALVVLISS
jgi:hypothetical protein